MPGPDLDVAIVGDGPAGLALAAGCRRAGLAVAVLGDGGSWRATYGMWRDEVPDLPGLCFRHVSARAIVHGHRRHVIERAYAIADNDALRAHLARGVDVHTARAARIQHFAWGSRAVTATGDGVDARLVVDATGRPAGQATRAAQSAFGVVVADLPPGFERDTVTLMDLRVPGGAGPIPTFCYVAPVVDGWLVEETVLAARPPLPADLLRERLVARLGATGGRIVAAARRVERVVIPVGGPAPRRRPPIVAFGAAAGYVHPATGFSVAASLRAAPRVAAAIAATVGRPDAGRVADAVWTPSMRCTRRIHSYGLEVLLRLSPDELARFFDTFFELPVATWAPYLRLDASPGEVSLAMMALVRRAPWSLRRRLVVNPFGGP